MQCLEHLSLFLLFFFSLLARKHGVPVGLHCEGVATLTVGNDNRLYQGSHQVSPSGADPFAPPAILGYLSTSLLCCRAPSFGMAFSHPLRCAEPRSPNPFRHNLSLPTLFDNER